MAGAVPLGAQSSGSAAPQGTLRTFDVAKPAALPAISTTDAAQLPAKPPKSTDTLRTSVGFGYVQGADWGTELLANGAVAGAQVQLNALVTKGQAGLLFDHGSLSIFDPDARWRIEAGDVFSQLRGASLGGRLSWAAAAGRRPSVAFYAPRHGSLNQKTVVSYRDQIVLRGQTLFDAELASDRSYFMRSRISQPRFEIESAYRSQSRPTSSRDGSVSASAAVWRGVSLTGGLYRSVYSGDRSRWNTVALRLPIARFLDLTLERAFGATRHTSRATSAVMTTVTAGDVRFFHRQQYGEYEFVSGGFANTIQRQQTQSMASYAPGPRVNLALQLATQTTDTGQVQHWEELQTTLKATRTTTVRFVTAVPNLRDTRRFQAYVRQELPGRFALHADYGRVSAFQAIARELDRSRFKVMLFKTVDVATPARGADVTGRVLDNSGRGVAGARVKLGPFTADTDRTGAYRLRHVPPGEYDVSLERHLLPADFAWDGRQESLKLKSGGRAQVDLRVAPLNAIHGRVYADRNGNRRFDSGEGVAGAVLQLGDRVTATDHNGGYSFFNVWPDRYEVRLHRVPQDLEAQGEQSRVVQLLDGGPLTGVDFIVTPKTKPIIWESPKR
jgi:Carboxypeptidase regulatory-like domain